MANSTSPNSAIYLHIQCNTHTAGRVTPRLGASPGHRYRMQNRLDMI